MELDGFLARFSVARWVPALTFVAAAALPALGQLAYRDASAGMETPRMEGGRTELEIGDVNADGHPDIVMIGDHGSPHVNSDEHGVTVWFGDGAGNWSAYQNGEFGYGGVALGDVNGDGRLDVGYGMHHDYSNNDFGDQLLEVALGDGSGRNWTPWDDGLAANGETWGMFGTDFADVDHDGDLDVGSISFGCCAGLHVYLNHGDGAWTQSWGFVGGNSAQDFSFGDVNGDGHPDFAAAHGSGTVYLGDGRGGFALADGNLPPLQNWRGGVALGDVNDDGRDDLAFISNARGIAVFTWTGPGQWRDLSGSLPAGGDYRLTQIADVNADGHGDIIAFKETAIEVYTGDGDGGWILAAGIPTQPNTCGYSALRVGGDVDHNGRPDIAVVAEENCRPFVGGINRARVYVEDSAPRRLEVFPAFPRGGETWIAGSVQFVDWTAAVPTAPQRIGTATIEFSPFGPRGPWQKIAVDAANNGRFQWRVPARMPDSDRCHVRLAVRIGEDAAQTVTPGAFRIVNDGNVRFGDFDGNQRVDLIDVWRFQQCFDGGAGGPIEPACLPGDANGDRHVDLADYRAFASELGGP